MPKNLLPQLGADGRILEGIVTTRNADGTTNVAPMGPIIDPDFTTLIFRPFKTSTTYHNLVNTHAGVLHVTDDVELFATAAIDQADAVEFQNDESLILRNACRAYEFEIIEIDDAQDRATFVAHVKLHHTEREFFGFNRAQYAVIEAAILATRLHLLPTDEVATEFARLEKIVQKTGAASEHRAFNLLKQHVVVHTGLITCREQVAQ
jgi:hypothetical protein